MPLTVAIAKETAEGERRVAIDPSLMSKFSQLGLHVLIEKDAGKAAYIPDEQFKGATFVDNSADLYAQADIIFRVQKPSAEDVAQMKPDSIVISTFMAYSHADLIQQFCDKNITSFSMELIPRISRAQSMDVLSSQASIAGYKAAIMGANLSSRFFPMLTTAAGTIRPSKVIVLGVGVAGLQAIATAKRLGAIVEAYDLRPETIGQVKSLGARFIELSLSATGEGGYARELTAEEKKQQNEELSDHISKANVIITSAGVPGRPAPKLISEATVNKMQKGTVIIDLVAEGGGNCALTQAGKTIDHNGVIIHGPLNVSSQVAAHASEMYAKNLFNFLSPMIKEGEFKPNWDDELIAKSLLTRNGKIQHKATRELIEGA